MLIDYAGKQYYDLCTENYSFVIRDRHEVNTSKDDEEKLKLLIWDKTVERLAGESGEY